MSDLTDRLEELQRSGLRRRLRNIQGAQGPRVTLDGREMLLLCSNNYLGLADHPKIKQAAADGASRWGAGSGASRLVSGSMDLHLSLEEALAGFMGLEGALLFGSGYLANIGAVSALAGEGEAVFSDELNHASIVDGCRLAKAETFVYRHGDLEHLEWGLRRAGERGALIVTDGIFSMDGDLAPLNSLVELAQRYSCKLMVDEAHAVGALGPGGRGTVAAAGLTDQVDLIVGTLGKSLGSYGAFVCAGAETVDYLCNTARTLIFSTAPPPPSVAAGLAALEMVEADGGLVESLHRNVEAMRRALADEGLAVDRAGPQIIPLKVGEPEAAVTFSERLLEVGVFCQAIRPPTVPDGTSRLRMTVMASHRESELVDAARQIGRVARDLDILPERAEQSTGESAQALCPPAPV